MSDDEHGTRTFSPQYGLCPECERNDGLVCLDEILWAVCHRHRSRWEVDPDVLECSFVPEGQPEEEELFRPAAKYKVVEPVGVPPKSDSEPWPLYADMLERDRIARMQRPNLTLVRNDRRGGRRTVGGGILQRISRWVTARGSRRA